MTQYHSLTSIMKWAGVQNVEYVMGIPYVWKDGLYCYFTKTEDGFRLSMTSLDDLAEMTDE